jgi:hypothetical protein
LHEASSIPSVPEKAVLEMIMSGIGESSWSPVMNAAGSPYGGVLQGNVRDGTFKIDDTEGMARCFLLGGKGFQGGGAIALANAHPDWEDGRIATTVEAGGEKPSFYGQYRAQAEKILEAYGGGGFGGTVYTQQFNFEIGSIDDPHEDYWDGINRLAEEVRWPFFLDGSEAYFDPETTLIRQRPAAIIRRGDPALIKFHATYDDRHIATEAELQLVCDVFEFRAGQVLKLEDLGPAASGSSVGLPGRWLIKDMRRKKFDLVTTFTLKQPEKPKKEPASTQAERTDPAEAGGDVSGTPKDIIDSVILPIANEVGIHITPLMVEQANARHGPTTSGGRSDHQGPPEEAWAADMSNGTAPTPEMDRLADTLARKFGFDVASDHVYNAPKITHGGYQFQLIYRSMVGGNHFNHVHFGVHRVAGSNKDPKSLRQLWTLPPLSKDALGKKK